MKDEAEPITDDEWLLRRIHHDRFRTDKVPLISPGAFEPRLKGCDRDTTGISLYRVDCLADPHEVLATVSEENLHKNGIVRIPKSLFDQLKLDILIEPDNRIKGHVVIRQLNANDYKGNKAVLLPKQLALAEEASKDENIVLRPRNLDG